MNIVDFMRKWGDVPLIRLADGRLALWHHGDDPMLALAELDLAGVRDDAEIKVARRIAHPSFSHDVKIENGRNWFVNEEDPLRSTTLSGGKLEKLSWNPVTGETLLVWPGQHHASVHGRAPFDDYVRIIVLPYHNKVNFRPFLPTWAQIDDPNASLEQDDLADLSFEAQQACERALRAAGAKGWDFQYNVNNAVLLDMTGRNGW